MGHGHSGFNEELRFESKNSESLFFNNNFDDVFQNIARESYEHGVRPMAQRNLLENGPLLPELAIQMGKTERLSWNGYYKGDHNHDHHSDHNHIDGHIDYHKGHYKARHHGDNHEHHRKGDHHSDYGEHHRDHHRHFGRHHHGFADLFEQLQALKREIQNLKYAYGFERPDFESQNGRKNFEKRFQSQERVITDTDSTRNGHFYAEGQDLELSQEAFKKHYGIPMEIDLLKFMQGKANNGQVTDFFQSPVSGGLGGRLENGELKWNDPDYHSLKYDFCRNFAQIFKYTEGMSEHEAKEFAFNFARTQKAVFEANGFDLQKIENEKVYSSGEGSEGWTDFVQDIGGTDSKINW